MKTKGLGQSTETHMENIHIKEQCLDVHPCKTLCIHSKVSHNKVFIFLALFTPCPQKLYHLSSYLLSVCIGEQANFHLAYAEQNLKDTVQMHTKSKIK